MEWANRQIPKKGRKGITMKLLIVEDDVGLSRGISFAFEQDGWTVFTAQTLKRRACFWKKKIRKH